MPAVLCRLVSFGAILFLLGVTETNVAAAEEDTSHRTDALNTKITLLEEAYRGGRLDLAMSLVESLKDTLSHETRLKPLRGPFHVVSGSAKMTDTLPTTWTAWAEGWNYYHAITLAETAGIDRINEPVHLHLTFPAKAMSDPWRELRLVRVDPSTRSLKPIPSQVTQHTWVRGEHACELVFSANVPKLAEVGYLVFFGNANAERPSDTSDLSATGSGYALSIENQHYQADLAPQMGQLERLVSKRQHSLELFAGGKGHGEPPSIDWAHDYVDEGHFQKLRIKNWEESPNHRVIRGPVCIQVRRWGFPHSPIHPLFTPSRMHIDQTYTFYSRVPYFFKEGTMEAIVDMKIAAMRDDEWVFSGYSFDETLWFDRDGSLHEGKITPGHENDLWGVGFFHRTSRDAFVALWLEHDVTGHPAIQHGGAPTLQYDGHGQLWSRYPANEADLTKGTVFKQRNAYLLTHYPENGGREMLEQLRRQLVNPLQIRSMRTLDRGARTPAGRLARAGETAEAGIKKREIWEVLREVKDEQLYQIDANIVDLGYVYDLRIENGVATVVVTMPHGGRPVYQFLETQGGGRVSEGILERVRRVEGIDDVVVEYSQTPEWTIHRVSDYGRAQLGIVLP